MSARVGPHVNLTSEAFTIIKTTVAFEEKKATDANFNAFVTQNHTKIQNLFHTCWQGFAGLQSPNLVNEAKKILNGSVTVIVSKPCNHFKIRIGLCQREPLADQEFNEALRRWCTNSTVYVRNFLTSCPIEKLKQFLDEGEGAEITIVAAETESLTFVCPQTK